MDLSVLQRVLERETLKLIVVTPNFQNPTGATLSAPARSGLLRMAADAGVTIVENDTYGDLRYFGESIPNLKQIDGANVVLLRTFSKVSFPGLRVGWVIGPRPLVARLAEAKQWTDLHSDHLSQAVMLRFAESGRLEAHRQRILRNGAKQLESMLDGCEEFMPKGTAWTKPQGGMNMWVRLPGVVDPVALLERAQRAKVTYLPGRFFEVSRPNPSALRLSFGALAPEKISAGLAILGRIFKEETGRARAVEPSDPAPAMV
jgi:2-aminoadipate transaminase